MRQLHAIPVTAGNRREVVQAIEHARAELAAGHVVCIFAEGAVTRTGSLLPFKRGLRAHCRRARRAVVPIYLDRVWGSIFSYKGGKFFWKLPSGCPTRSPSSIGQPLRPAVSAAEAGWPSWSLPQKRRAIGGRADLLHTEYIRIAKRRWRHPRSPIACQNLTHGRTLVGAMLFARLLKQRTKDERMVGLLLPVGRRRARQHRRADGRTDSGQPQLHVGKEALEAAIAQAGIRTIVTSRTFLTKASLPELPGMVFLEDLRKDIGRGAKIGALLQAG